MLGDLWKPEMGGYCPFESPIRDPGFEARSISFWRQWWASQRQRFESDPSFPLPTAPARYSAPPPKYERVAVSRVQGSLNALRVQELPPSPELTRKFSEESAEILKTGLLELQRELSPDGWATILNYMDRHTPELLLSPALSTDK
jgi:hypothetical protein